MGLRGAGSPGSQMVTDGALGLSVHVTQKLGISRASVFSVVGSRWGVGGREMRTLLR